MTSGPCLFEPINTGDTFTNRARALRAGCEIGFRVVRHRLDAASRSYCAFLQNKQKDGRWFPVESRAERGPGGNTSEIFGLETVVQPFSISLCF